MEKNIILTTDAYKISHHLGLQENITNLYSYGESRVGSKYPFVSYFGMSMLIQDHLLQKVTDEMIEEAAEESYMTFGTEKYFNRSVWEKVRDLGYLPIEIKSAPEGRKIPINNVLFTIESTEKWFAKTVNSLEDVLMHIWYPTTVSTRSMYIKEKLRPLVEKSGTIENLDFMVNDFGLRGATCLEAAERGGAAHLVHFQGSDNMPASRAIKNYYGYKGRAKSVWATEHSVALSFGPGQGEFDYMNHQLDKSEELGESDKILSIVIDTYDAFNFLQNVVGSPEISERIKNRKGRVVFRPDSGEPKYSIERCLEILAGIFGYFINNKGYKVINYNVGLLQGDGMNEDTIIELYEAAMENRWSVDNFVTGSGGGLLQVDINRDTQTKFVSYGF